MNKALFLDRDGVICELQPDGEYYLLRLEQFKLIPGIKDLLRSAKNKGYIVIVVTNQPQISKKLLTSEDLQKIHDHMKQELEGMIDAIYICPHQSGEGCNCRKPGLAMFLQAQKDHQIDFSNSVVLGDSDKDINAGRAIGCKTIFLSHNLNEEEIKACKPDHTIFSLREATSLLA